MTRLLNNDQDASLIQRLVSNALGFRRGNLRVNSYRGNPSPPMTLKSDSNLSALSHNTEGTPIRALNPKYAAQRLAQTAHTRLIARLEAYGNILSHKHRRALQHLVLDLSLMAYGLKRGRYGYPIPTGGGKTQAAACWAWAMAEIDPALSVTIATSRIESLGDIRNELIDLGVPSTSIGVLHSEKTHATLTPIDIEAADQYPILLVTHARVQGGPKAFAQYSQYKGQKRSLTIYDESLVTTSHWSVPLRALVLGASGATALIQKLPGEMTEMGKVAYDYLAKVEAVATSRSSQWGAPKLLRVPDLPSGYDAATLQDGLFPEHRGLLSVVFDYAGQKARVLEAQNQSGLVSFSVLIPDELEPMAVLDASLTVRLLPELAEEVKAVENFPEDIITYENVTLHHLQERGGRGAIKELVDDAPSLKAFAKEIARVIGTAMDPDDAINVFTFKERDKTNYIQLLKDALSNAGVDIDATIFFELGCTGQSSTSVFHGLSAGKISAADMMASASGVL